MQDRDSRLIYEAYTQVLTELAPAPPGMPINLGGGDALESGDVITLKIPEARDAANTRVVKFKVDAVNAGRYINLVPQEEVNLNYNFPMWASQKAGNTRVTDDQINPPTPLQMGQRIRVQGKDWETILGGFEPKKGPAETPAQPGQTGQPGQNGQPADTPEAPAGEDGPWYDDPDKVSWSSQLNPFSKANLSRNLAAGGGNLGLKGSMGSWGKRISNKAMQRLAPEVEPEGPSIYGHGGKAVPAGTKMNTGHEHQRFIQPSDGTSPYAHVRGASQSKMAGTRR